MHQGLRIVGLVVLTVLVVGGWVGALGFLGDPSGAGMGLSTAELPDSPLLADFTVPGKGTVRLVH